MSLHKNDYKKEERSLNVKVVALYTRKSRGDSDEDLKNHQYLLKEMCSHNKWKYIEYSEIGSGDSIEVRPIFQKLLKDIADDLFDAILVVDWDRMGRGDLGDQDRIKKTLKKSNTMVITPNKWYDLENDDDDFNIDARAFLARQEYKMIKSRMTRGKKIGARLGRWTNGTAPYPYVYNAVDKKLIINEMHLKVYNFIMDTYLMGYSGEEISWRLNREGIKSPRNKLWNSTSIIRLLKDETHLGRIISNKTEGSFRDNRSKDFKEFLRSDWIVVENCHEPVKTQAQHDKIITIMNKNNKIPVAARAGKFPLSGLIKCGVCGYSMTLSNSRHGTMTIRKCSHYDPYGNICSNKGGSAIVIHDIVELEVENLINKLENRLKNNDESDDSEIKVHIRKKNQEIINKESAIEKVEEGFESGVYTAERAKQRKNKLEIELEKLQDDLELLERSLARKDLIDEEDRLRRLNIFWEKIKNKKLDNYDLNRYYKEILESVIWTKEDGNDPRIKVNFL